MFSDEHIQEFGGSGQHSRRTGIFTTRDVARVLFKHKGTIVGTFVLVTVLLAAANLYIPASYQVDARVLIKTDRIGTPQFFSGITAVREPVFPDPVERQISNELELVASRSTVSRTVDRLNLQYEHVTLKPHLYIVNLAVDTYDGVMRDYFGKMPDPDKRGRDKVIELMQKGITVAPVVALGSETNSNIVEVTLAAPDPELAVTVMETLLDTYTRYDVRLNQEAGQEAYEIIKEQYEAASTRVTEAQAALELFLSDKGVTRRAVLGAGVGVTMQMRAESVPPTGQRDNNQSGLSALTSPRDESVVNVLKARLVQLDMDLLELRSRYPESSSIIRNLEQERTQLGARLEEEIIIAATNEAELITLERNLRVAEDRFLELDRRLTEISLFLDVNKSQLSRVVIAAPVLPRDSEWKKKVLTVALGGVAGLLLGILFAVFREYTDKSFRTADEIRRVLGFEVGATLPKLDETQAEDSSRLNAPASDLSALEAQAPAIRRLCMRVLAQGNANGANAERPVGGLLTYVVSCDRLEGKTFVAIALARHFVDLLPGEVLIVDANFDNPQLAGLSGSDETAAGFYDLLQSAQETGAAAAADLPVYATATDGLFVMGAGTKPKPGILYNRQAVDAAAAAMRERFAAVVVDGGGLAGCGSGRLLHSGDRVVMVLESEETRRAVAANLLDYAGLAAADDRPIAVVNKRVRYLPRFLYRAL